MSNTLIIEAMVKHTLWKRVVCCAKFGISDTCTGENLCFLGVKWFKRGFRKGMDKLWS